MAKQGYDQTTIRDVGRETGFSVAGMYYYFKGKEDLLFQIQQRTFASLLEEQRREVERAGTPEEKLRRLARNYLSFYTRYSAELKVCTFELESIKGEQYREIEKLRRAYFRLAASVVEELLEETNPEGANGRRIRHVTLFIFGMLNWVFLWFDPRKDGSADRLADEMVDMVLHGMTNIKPQGRRRRKV
jgi:AcrR family transcriptional regulator